MKTTPQTSIECERMFSAAKLMQEIIVSFNVTRCLKCITYRLTFNLFLFLFTEDQQYISIVVLFIFISKFCIFSYVMFSFFVKKRRDDLVIIWLQAIFLHTRACSNKPELYPCYSLLKIMLYTVFIIKFTSRDILGRKTILAQTNLLKYKHPPDVMLVCVEEVFHATEEAWCLA